MIQIALIIVTSLAIMVAALLNYAPNYKKIMNSDFMRRSYDYANYRAMEEAQLRHRARSLVPGTTTPVSNAACLYQVDGEGTCLKINGQLNYTTNITVTLTTNAVATP